MYRQCTRSLVLIRNGFPQRQGILCGSQIRFNATAPPKPPRADLGSIPQALRELLPQPRKRDPNAPQKKRRGPWIYIGLVSSFFIWIKLESYFDARPLLEKKRKRILRERLQRLREEGRSKPLQIEDPESVVAYLHLLLRAMLPEDVLKNLRSEELLALLQEEIPEKLLVLLRNVTPVVYQLSMQPEDEDGEVKVAENIQDSAEEILRRTWLVLHHRLPPRRATSESSSV
ncbi:hypothetical protein DFH09DRAFT_1220442 [Mycena vulgaris]|nr:hypothetical protein DFH09DRAFT_1220442 [Mycena vulgaris]